MIRAQRARYAQEQARLAQQQALYNQQYASGSSYPQRYGPPPGNPYAGYGPGYGGGYGNGYGYDDYPQRRQRGGNSALPLLGALAGGLLLGDIIGGF
jgi:hypothetical protein